MDETEDNPSEGPSVSATDPIELTAGIVIAFIAHNSLPASELTGLIANVHRAIAGLTDGQASSAAQPAAEAVEKPTPAQIRKSVTPDGIVSFLDGKTYKTMKRHLGKHGLDPASYRDRYGLASDYPMVAPNYAAQRSALARSIGLGRPGGMTRSETTLPKPKKRERKATEQA